MTSFFQLGGVLIATSNRMPEELAKAAGVEFGRPPPRLQSMRWRFPWTDERDRIRSSDNMFAGKGEFADFLDVLKARCDVWEMDGGKDYRRQEAEESMQAASLSPAASLETSEDLDEFLASVPGLATNTDTQADAPKQPLTQPPHYFIPPSVSAVESDQMAWLEAFNSSLLQATGLSPSPNERIPWLPSTMLVYGRTVTIPRAYNGTTYWTFAELCSAHLGPADYITLASSFHTLILTDVPILTILQKNEARRFITLLDALY